MCKLLQEKDDYKLTKADMAQKAIQEYGRTVMQSGEQSSSSTMTETQRNVQELRLTQSRGYRQSSESKEEHIMEVKTVKRKNVDGGEIIETETKRATKSNTITCVHMEKHLKIQIQEQHALLSSIGCDRADVEELIFGKQSNRSCPVGISPRKAVKESKLLFNGRIFAACHQCGRHINCFRFSLTLRNNDFRLECGKHPMECYWKRVCSTFKAAVWISRFGTSIEGTCNVCADLETCVLHVLDDWQLCHDIAHAKGGKVTIRNIAPGYAACNLAQRTKKFSEYIASIGGMVQPNSTHMIALTEFSAMFPNARSALLEQLRVFIASQASAASPGDQGIALAR